MVNIYMIPIPFLNIFSYTILFPIPILYRSRSRSSLSYPIPFLSGSDTRSMIAIQPITAYRYNHKYIVKYKSVVITNEVHDANI